MVNGSALTQNNTFFCSLNGPLSHKVHCHTESNGLCNTRSLVFCYLLFIQNRSSAAVSLNSRYSRDVKTQVKKNGNNNCVCAADSSNKALDTMGCVCREDQ